MKHKKILFVETLVVIALIVIISLFFAMKSAAQPQVAPVTAPAVPTASGTPESSAALQPKRPPQCTFPLAGTTAEEPGPEEYTFSKPKVVLTNAEDLYDIVEWLPDNERVLLVQELRSHINKIIQQSIQLYDPQTGEIQVYATRNQTIEPPSWLPGLNAVLYPVTNVLGIDEKNHRFEFTRQIWASRGNPQATQLIADNLPQFYVAVKPGGSEIAYLSDQQISRRNNSLIVLPPVPFDAAQWDYSKGRTRELPVSYKMAWQPGTALIFLYSDGDTGGGYTFILDSNSGRVCELDLAGWAARARWSPSGRYLAIARFQGRRPADSSDLVVLDAISGKLYIMGVIPSDMEGRHYVSDIAWAPDDRHVLAVGSVFPPLGTGQMDSIGLYLSSSLKVFI